jgi:hypothetical protein
MAAGAGYARIDLETAVGLWPFDEGDGEEATDWSGRGNHGTLAGGAEWVPGKFGTAVRLSTVGDWVDCGNDDSLEAHTGSFSIVCWMYPEEMTSSRPVFKNDGKAPPFTGYFLYVDPGGLLYHGFGDGVKSAPQAGVPGLKVETWSHVAAVRDVQAKKVRLYVDGEVKQEVDDPTTDIVFTGSNLIIGSRPGIAHEQFFGIMDDVALFRAVLSTEDLNALMTRGLADMVLDVSAKGKLATAWGSLKASGR